LPGRDPKARHFQILGADSFDQMVARHNAPVGDECRMPRRDYKIDSRFLASKTLGIAMCSQVARFFTESCVPILGTSLTNW
jgi:hypothetical protein